MFASRHEYKFEVREDEMQTIRVSTPDGSLEIDLPTGRLTVDQSIGPSLPEYLTLAFVIGLLFVTIQKATYIQVNFLPALLA